MGLDKLQGWQSTIWSYWQAIKGVGGRGKSDPNAVKKEVQQKLKEYKHGIEKVRMAATCNIRTYWNDMRRVSSRKHRNCPRRSFERRNWLYYARCCTIGELKLRSPMAQSCRRLARC